MVADVFGRVDKGDGVIPFPLFGFAIAGQHQGTGAVRCLKAHRKARSYRYSAHFCGRPPGRCSDTVFRPGATEQHLIEELASVSWRKRRVHQAEMATVNQGLKVSARKAKSVIPATASFEMGLSGDGTDIRDLIDLTPKDMLRYNGRRVT